MADKTIIFNAGHLFERGTDVAMYDYAHFNEELLKNHSIIVSPQNANNSAFEKFNQRFEVKLYSTQEELEDFIREKQADYYYTIVEGGEEWLPKTQAKTLVHAVFTALTPFGDVYATISDWVVDHRSHGSIPIVNHMIHLPEVSDSLREELNIPQDAIVFGRHGGIETFDIPFVHDVISNFIYRRKDVYFVFLNTLPFHEHPRIIYLDPIIDLERKTRFINTCDAMLHARIAGESFGLACGEFSIRNKPVITWLGGYDKHHIRVLFGKGGLFYNFADDLYQQLDNFRPQAGDFDCYSRRFNPQAVMRQFEEVFLLRD